MKSTNNKVLKGIQFVIDVNFYLSVLVLIVGGLVPVMSDYMLFEFNEDLYGVFAQNLKMMLLYLGFAEILLIGYCLFRKNKQIFLFVGIFFLLLMSSLPIYEEINTVETDPNISWFFLYIGLSHGFFGLYAYLEKNPR